ncbi:hypothetical protein CEV08_04745 [Bartonella tribocorum]|uniref:Uncharacterized protein n=1 Tax=Bartonella tribocorum TaxID=85701 RepID=A0A2M6UVA5_9HYPH|nr:hypothetical protein CEV08_04745 [Bartonella tribocorum]
MQKTKSLATFGTKNISNAIYERLHGKDSKKIIDEYLTIMRRKTQITVPKNAFTIVKRKDQTSVIE